MSVLSSLQPESSLAFSKGAYSLLTNVPREPGLQPVGPGSAACGVRFMIAGVQEGLLAEKLSQSIGGSVHAPLTCSHTNPRSGYHGFSGLFCTASCPTVVPRRADWYQKQMGGAHKATYRRYLQDTWRSAGLLPCYGSPGTCRCACWKPAATNAFVLWLPGSGRRMLPAPLSWQRRR